MMRAISVAAIVMCGLTLLPTAAAAQEGATTPAPGPMSVEQVHNGFTAAPDVRISRLDGSTAWVAGAYAGWVLDEHLLLGGGIYGLTSPHAVHDMVYGGGVVGWFVNSDAPVSLARGPSSVSDRRGSMRA
jgi:hypothetical protein